MKEITIKRNENFTIMANFHFKERKMSLKAKGLLSLMLSLPDNWDYSINGLSVINKDGRESVQSACKELEAFGYLKRLRKRDSKGRLGSIEYVIYDEPQGRNVNEPTLESKIIEYTTSISEEPETDYPETENPYMDNPYTENPITDKPKTENPLQLSTNELSTYSIKNQIISNQLSEELIDDMIEQLKEQISYDCFDCNDLELQGVLNDIINSIVYQIYLANDDIQYNLGNHHTLSIKVLKSLFKTNLSFAIVKSYIAQFRENKKRITNAPAYHIKSLYLQCLGHCTLGQSKYCNL